MSDLNISIIDKILIQNSVSYRTQKYITFPFKERIIVGIFIQPTTKHLILLSGLTFPILCIKMRLCQML